MEPVAEIALITVLIAGMSVAAYLLRMLTVDGAVASFATGMTIGLFGGLEWFLLLLLFTVAGFAATKAGITKKREKGLQEGDHGERTYKNVLGVGIAPCLFAFISYLADSQYDVLMGIAFISSIAVAAADTIASEIGVKDQRVWMITTLERVPPGTDGGISLSGTVYSLIGALGVSAIGWLVLYRTVDALILIPALAGFLGCILDSLLGATLETDGRITKYVNNASTAVLGSLISVAMAWPFLVL